MSRRSLLLALFLVLLCTPLFGVGADVPADLPAETPPDLAAATSYSSGWREIGASQATVLNHNLAAADPGALAVDLMFLDERPGGLGIHSRGYGGMLVGEDRIGAHWQNLTEDQIVVSRNQDDEMAPSYLLRMWYAPSEPQYDSGWVEIAPNQRITLTHALGGDAADYVAALRFRNTNGVHLIGIGGINGEEYVTGGFFSMLDEQQLVLQRIADDVLADEMRISIYAEPPGGSADYDTGWTTVEAGATTVFTHGLGTVPGHLIVQMSQRSATRYINTMGVGGYEQDGLVAGAAWQNLTDNTVAIWRGAADPFAQEVRLRIWRHVAPCVPELISPDDGALMDNGCRDGSDLNRWEFTFSECPGALQYEVEMSYPTLINPIVATVTEPPYIKQSMGYYREADCVDWTWRVRAETADGWGAWSETRTFDVELPNTDCPLDVFLPVVLE